MNSISKNGFNFETDHLLSNKKIFIDNRLNIYAVLVKKEDMLNNKKGTILKKCVYFHDNSDLIKNLISKIKDENYIYIRSELSNYLKIKRIRKDTFCNWLNKNLYPLPLIRVLSLISKINIFDMIKFGYFTDFCDQSSINFPCNLDEINNDFLTYFIGLHIGDGTLNEERWKIVDGDRCKYNLKYSYDFLCKINNKIKTLFLINNGKIRKVKNKNAYELLIHNKWFCRYLNFVFGFNFYKKTDPRIPKLFYSKKHLVVRGLFDTDGSIKNYKISFGTIFLGLFIELCNFLDLSNIKYNSTINKKYGRKPLYSLIIQRNHNFSFIKLVGFSHPRKILEIKCFLSSTSLLKDFKGYSKSYSPIIPHNDFMHLCKFVRPIKNAGKVRFLSKIHSIGPSKKENIFNNFRKNFKTNKIPNDKGYVNSYKIERLFTDYCVYSNNRVPMKKIKIQKIINPLQKFLS